MNSGDWLYSSWAEQYCGLTVIVWMLSLVCWLLSVVDVCYCRTWIRTEQLCCLNSTGFTATRYKHNAADMHLVPLSELQLNYNYNIISQPY